MHIAFFIAFTGCIRAFTALIRTCMISFLNNIYLFCVTDLILYFSIFVLKRPLSLVGCYIRQCVNGIGSIALIQEIHDLLNFTFRKFYRISKNQRFILINRCICMTGCRRKSSCQFSCSFIKLSTAPCKS